MARLRMLDRPTRTRTVVGRSTSVAGPALLLAIAGCGGGASSSTPASTGATAQSSITCAAFAFQEDAQSYFAVNIAPQLDPDGNGVACDQLPKRNASSSTTTPTRTTAAGLYEGTLGNGRSFASIVLDDGTYWVVYSTIGNPSMIAGAVEGTSVSANGALSSSDGKDFNLESAQVLDATLSGTVHALHDISGLVSERSAGTNTTFQATYDASYDRVPTLATLAGTYTGNAVVVAVGEPVSLTLSQTGTIDGSALASGCRFSGRASVHPSGNVYDVTITFAGSPCANGTATVTGVAYLTDNDRRIYALGLNPARTNGFLALLSRQ